MTAKKSSGASKPKSRQGGPSRSRWAAPDHAHAISLLNQLERAIQKGKPKAEPPVPEYVIAEIPVAAANYLLDAIHQIKAGIPAKNALGLLKKRGIKSNAYRDLMIAKFVQEHEEALSLPKIFDLIRNNPKDFKFVITKKTTIDGTSDEAIRDALENGRNLMEYYVLLRDGDPEANIRAFGEEVANEFVDSLK